MSNLPEVIKEKNKNIDIMCRVLGEQLKLAVDFSHHVRIHERDETNSSTTDFNRYSDSGRRTVTIEYQL
jgi:hypothetical protein